MINPGPNEQLKVKLIAYVQDVRAMETVYNRTLEQYGAQVARFKEFPEFRAKVYHHLDVTRQYPAHWEGRMRFYNAPIPPVADAPTFGPIMSPLMDCFRTIQPTTFIDYATTLYTFSQFNIAVYRGLTTLAQTCEDRETVRFAEEHLRTAIEFQHWLFEHLPQIYLYTLQDEGVPFPPTAWEFAKQLELVGTTTLFPTVPTK